MLRLITVSIVVLLVAVPASAAQKENAHVRPVNPDLAKVIDDGLRRSATLRALVDELQQTDIVAFVEYDNLPNDLAGGLRFITRAGHLRLLRISLRRSLTKSQLLSTLGHELQHAIEIANAPQIVDHASLAAYYRGVDHDSTLPDRFDTPQARRAGDVVGSDLRGKSAPAPLSAQASATRPFSVRR